MARSGRQKGNIQDDQIKGPTMSNVMGKQNQSLYDHQSTISDKTRERQNRLGSSTSVRVYGGTTSIARSGRQKGNIQDDQIKGLTMSNVMGKQNQSTYDHQSTISDKTRERERGPFGYMVHTVRLVPRFV